MQALLPPPPHPTPHHPPPPTNPHHHPKDSPYRMLCLQSPFKKQNNGTRRLQPGQVCLVLRGVEVGDAALGARSAMQLAPWAGRKGKESRGGGSAGSTANAVCAHMSCHMHGAQQQNSTPCPHSLYPHHSIILSYARAACSSWSKQPSEVGLPLRLAGEHARGHGSEGHCEDSCAGGRCARQRGQCRPPRL